MLFSRLRVRLGLAMTLCGLRSAPAFAAEAQDGQPVPPATPLVTLDLHGEMRTRLDYLDGIRYTTSDPSIAPHLDVRHGESNTAPSDGRMGIGDLRLRFDPTLHVAEWADIRTQIDGVSNMVLGGQNNAARAGQDALGTQSWTSDTGGFA